MCERNLGREEMKRTWDEMCDMLKKQSIEIERLKNEKKWLEYKVLEASQKKHIGLSYDEKIVLLEEDMKQALKEE